MYVPMVKPTSINLRALAGMRKKLNPLASSFFFYLLDLIFFFFFIGAEMSECKRGKVESPRPRSLLACCCYAWIR